MLWTLKTLSCVLGSIKTKCWHTKEKRPMIRKENHAVINGQVQVQEYDVSPVGIDVPCAEAPMPPWIFPEFRSASACLTGYNLRILKMHLSPLVN